MVKPKEVVVQEQEEEVKSEGLEIASIGSLYEGPWEKKYWSSSRGKDRYPYPVGYHAVRAHNGSMCKMEIHEGPKGPLFMITSADGPSCSGQTPDIAWDKFQKKYCPRMKTWHGKRLSCKIDGVEFFGFKNSFVQRLLRELVANVSGTAEGNLVSSSLCDGASSKEHGKHTDECTYQALQPDMERTQSTKKRSRCEIKNTKPAGRNGLKKPRSQVLTCDSEASNSVLINQRKHRHRSSMPLLSSKEGNDFHKHEGALSESEHWKLGAVQVGDGCSSAKDGFPFVSVDFSSDLTEGTVLTQEVCKLEGSKIGKSTGVANNLAEEGKSPDRSKNFSFLVAAKDTAGDAPVTNSSPGVENVNLHVPDILDFVQDNGTHSSTANLHKSTYNLNEDFTTANDVISEGLVTDSHAKEETGSFYSNIGSGKSDFDSVGQEIATAMMTVLLPQAIPLLDKISRKKKATSKASETLSGRVSPKEKNSKTSHVLDASFPDALLIERPSGESEEKMQILKMDLHSVTGFELSKSVVLDSFEDDICGDNLTNHVILCSKILEVDQPRIDKDENLSNSQKDVVVSDLRNESTVCVENSKSENILHHDETKIVLDKKLPEGDVCMSESVLGCRFSCKKVSSEKDEDVCVNLDKNSASIRSHPVEKDIIIESNCTEDANDANQTGLSSSVRLAGEDISVNIAATETVSVAPVPNKVYARKKVAKIAPAIRNFSGPLSESIICRNFGNDCVPETSHATETLVVSAINQMRSSDDKQHTEEFFGAKTRLDRQSHLSSVISQNPTLFSNSKGKDICDSSDPYIIHMKKSEAHSEKELLGKMNLVESNPSGVSQKQEMSFYEYNFNTKELKVSSDAKHQKKIELNNELEGIAKFVGCYFHPMPISSVLLTTEGDEIYICVSCGLLDDKNRTLFLYKVAIQEPSVGCPSFIGHTSVLLPFLKDIFSRDIALERSCLLFTPDGQRLVLLGSIKTPYCREGRIGCLCSTCTSDCFEKNSVKIVQVKSGYVSVVTKLKTDDNVQCILVCEPNYIIAVGESGKLHLWEMNSTWSAQIGEFVIPVDDYIYPGIMELKRIPNYAPLVVGHNGFGEFVVWDISRRLFVSRFSAPSASIYQFFPINFFCWQRNVSVFAETNLKGNISGNMAATKLWFSKHNESNSYLPSEGEDIAIWLLVSTVSDTQDNHISSDCQTNPVRFWRLAILVKNMVILGSPLDPRAAAIGSLRGHGILGTEDGLVYMWELSTGNKLGSLHHFEGGTVSCIATDDSSSQVLAVAGGGQLLVYMHTGRNIADQ